MILKHSAGTVSLVQSGLDQPVALAIDHKSEKLCFTEVPTPRAFPNSAILRGVATTSGGGAWSVGGLIEIDPSGSAAPEQTLIHRYTP